MTNSEDQNPIFWVEMYAYRMQTLPAHYFDWEKLEMMRVEIEKLRASAQTDAEKKILKRGCFWWNKLASHWNERNGEDNFELFELKEETKALIIRPSPTAMTEAGRKVLELLRIKWTEDEDEDGA